jgi:hypothetical protein
MRLIPSLLNRLVADGKLASRGPVEAKFTQRDLYRLIMLDETASQGVARVRRTGPPSSASRELDTQVSKCDPQDQCVHPAGVTSSAWSTAKSSSMP